MNIKKLIPQRHTICHLLGSLTLPLSTAEPSPEGERAIGYNGGAVAITVLIIYFFKPAPDKA
jgi:hypothetical protein